MTSYHHRFTAALATLLLVSAPAWAQDDGTLVVEEILVTAEKRETSLQDTNIALSVHSGDSLQGLNIQDAQQLIVRDPSTAVVEEALARIITGVRVLVG